MGYNVEMSLSNVVIPMEKIEGALKAINDLFKPERLKRGGADELGWQGIQTRHYSWVNTPREPFTDIVEALAKWRYQAGILGPGLIVEYFTGEKLGDDSILWTALAPFVRPGAEITLRGEDNDAWKWFFDGKKLREKVGRVVFEEFEPVKKEIPKPKSTVKRPGLGLDGPRRI